ncbi:MAG: hypothetical protein KF752_10970 [Pirellulaceae bacterium]|nr:hypothetical protein [Pirellulaceae bacterium]
MSNTEFGSWVDVKFDCLPLRSVRSFAAPDDASPKLAAKLERMRVARESHGSMGSYYLHNATCTFHFTNDPALGMCQYSFEGVVLTDSQDMQARSCELTIELARDTCSWINQAIVDWLAESVQRAVLVEFNRFIQAGDLTKTIQRLESMNKASDDAGGFVGMYL